MSQISVGQVLFYVSNRRGATTSKAVVTKIGRKWAQLDNGHRVDIENLWADGGQYSSPGRCYLKEQDYLDEVEAAAISKAIRNHSPVFKCSIENLREAQRLLGVVV